MYAWTDGPNVVGRKRKQGGRDRSNDVSASSKCPVAPQRPFIAVVSQYCDDDTDSVKPPGFAVLFTQGKKSAKRKGQVTTGRSDCRRSERLALGAEWECDLAGGYPILGIEIQRLATGRWGRSYLCKFGKGLRGWRLLSFGMRPRFRCWTSGERIDIGCARWKTPVRTVPLYRMVRYWAGF